MARKRLLKKPDKIKEKIHDVIIDNLLTPYTITVTSSNVNYFVYSQFKKGCGRSKILTSNFEHARYVRYCLFGALVLSFDMIS